MAEEVNPLIRALEQYDVLSDEERDALRALPLRTRLLQKNEEIIREGDRPTHSCLLVAGFAARTQNLEDGKRQITNLHAPGDFVDLHSLLLKRMDHNVIAFSDCEVAFIPHGALRELIDRHNHLSRLLWVTTLVDAAIDRAWITCLGRRPAIDHLAHFICELFTRLKGRGLNDGNSILFGATQVELGDILGMSTVHVNRTIQDLRKLGLIDWEAGRVTIRDFDRLADRAGFDPAYLNQWVEPR
ncbi:Crp/Fnr family transcriptional regulator [Tianweitania sediminis]|uniref:Crp/Fnr family transcriptional regulator n=1 Tax=Tianweitania sediminis TaxID=1502156 RepID=UPI001FD7EC70|nr:Crp/Fnr family transcriptional regulator [Tianweitania sediminis]